MGYMTLDDFTGDIVSALGNNYSDGPRLVRWVNHGYMDLAGAVDFEILNEEEEILTEVATQTIFVPDDTLVVELIQDTTSDSILSWLPRTEMMRRSLDSFGAPTHWHRRGSTVRLHPIPDDEYILNVLTKKSPNLLEVDDDVSIFSDIWDPAISMLATHYAFLGLGQEQRSAVWLTRAIKYITSRLTDTDFNMTVLGLASSVGLDKLNARLASLGGVKEG